MGARESLDVVRRMGLLDPARLASVAGAATRWGPSIATFYGAAALRHPNRPAVIDHRGTLRFAQLDRRSSSLAKGMAAQGLRPGRNIGILCHNHRDFVEANLAAAKAGLNAVYLNTGFAGPQLAEVLEREQVAGLVCDASLHHVAEAAGWDRPVIIADGQVDGQDSIGEIRRIGRRRPNLLLPRLSSPVLLTSGTTGVPKGARRGTATDPRAASGIMNLIPYQQGDIFVIACPLFHAWGLSQLIIAASLGSPVIVSPRFSTEQTVRSVIEHRATVLAVVPVMLQRLLADEDIDPSAMTTLRIVATSGSALPAPVATAWMDRVGEHLYNLYGSTEVGQATIATPADLLAAPGTAGRVVPGSEVVILDRDGRACAPGIEGRIFVRNAAQFSGYTGGGSKEVIDGRMSSGDVGYFDREGRLFVTGRADDMIISGGENVFPGEVEDVLLAHPDVADAAVVGVSDPDFGQRLAAFVVPAPGAVLGPTEIRELVAAQLARHKVPRDITFVDELPRTPTGKIRRTSLAEEDTG